MKNNRILLLIIAAIITVAVLGGCATRQNPGTSPSPSPSPSPSTSPSTGETDTTSSASIVGTEAAFLNAVGKNGTWIIATTKDLTINKDIVLEGEFENRGERARKIALYAQDENRNKTASYTLKAPKLIVRSENARIQGGTFVGDVYVEANNFLIVDAQVEGNVYFEKEEYKSSFKLEEGGTVTGKTEVKTNE